MGLNGYDLNFVFTELDGYWAEIDYDVEARGATLYLTTKRETPYEPDDDWVENTARHEMIHLLLAKLVAMAKSRYVLQCEIDLEDESIARTLAKLL